MKKKYFFLLLTILLLTSCKQNHKIEVNFLDEYVLKDSITFKNTIIGGLSGIDIFKNNLYVVVDDAKKPRFLKGSITIVENKIDTILFNNVQLLKDTLIPFYKNNYLDLESIFVNSTTSEINFFSEGSVNKGNKPTVFVTDLNGQFKYEYELPDSFQKLDNMHHNAVFEGASKGVSKKGFWAIMEAPLKSDGEKPTFTKTQSPVRLTYFDYQTKQATKQFAYQLEKITKPAKGNINLNGATAILEYAKNKFFILERTYQNNYGANANIVRIFDAEINNTTTDILKTKSLKKSNYIPLKKRLIFNFEEVKEQLTAGVIDNIEGIAFGPRLTNGRQSLILVSDDNFQVYGKQLNQFILMEIVKE